MVHSALDKRNLMLALSKAFIGNRRTLRNGRALRIANALS